MPSKEDHVKKAAGNERFALSISLTRQAGIDWALVVIFYAAVHYVEAYLAKGGQHLRSHTTRDKVVARDATLKHIYSEYHELKFYGFTARYEMYGFTADDFRKEAMTSFMRIKNFIDPLL